MFRPDEVEVADEILQEAAAAGPVGHYGVLVAAEGNRLLGWSCHGLVPLTDATYDLYWIIVDPAAQGRGVGKRLLSAIEAQLRSSGGRWLIAETSALPIYENTRQFYLRTGFAEMSHIPDFYRAGDGRLIFGRRLDAAS